MRETRFMTARVSTGCKDVIVVGGGPSGLSALFAARQAGLKAIGLEAGPRIASATADHLEGLVYVSPAWHYEIGGIPIDCADVSKLTREELLRYYARVVNMGDLDVRTHTRCVELQPHEDHVRVRAITPDGEQQFTTSHVVVTSWFRPRRADESLTVEPGCGVRVLQGMRCGLEVVGQRVVILGGGLSAREYAIALMLAGQPVTVVTKANGRAVHTPDFRALVKQTGSTIITGLQHARAADGALHCDTMSGPLAIECEVVIVATGAVADSAILDQLQRAEVLTAAECRRIAAGRNVEDALAHAPSAGWPQSVRTLLEEHQDLWTHLFDGVRRVRLAGGALHLGTSAAGVITSIFTATLAIRAILGEPPPSEFRRPLHGALYEWCTQVRPQTRFEAIRRLRPLPGTSRCNKWPADARTAEGSPDQLHRIVALCNGSRSVEEIATASGAASLSDRAALASQLAWAWYHNLLTWLPPPRGLDSTPLRP